MESAEDVPRRKFDIIVFGASGFTGQYVVEELARTVDEENGVTWAIAGRNMKNLQNVLATASKETGKDLSDLTIIIADVCNEKSLQEMCSQAKVILNCVGPYRFYGTPVVKACIEQKCHHVDICGEPEWLERVQLLYDYKAKESGIFILEACGFDSIPVEMGLLYTKQQFNGDLNTVETYISINYGPEVQFQPYLCLPSFFRLILTIMTGMIIFFFSRCGCGQRLLTRYPHVMSLGLFSKAGPTRKQVEGASFVMTFVGRGFATKIANVEKDHEDLPDKKIVTEVAGPETAYKTTPICMVQAAYVLLKEKDNLPKGGGVYTPGAAFADTKLLARLQQHDLKFSLVEK